MPADRKKTVAFPVDILAREFDGKLLLALCAAERGWNVLIGGREAVNESIHRRKPCVYFAKSARSGNSRLFARLKLLGHQVVVLDEEALVRQSDDFFMMKHEKDALENVDLLLTWGEDSRELWLRSKMLGGLRTETAGNPRIDMLLPQLRGYHQENIDAIRSRYGDFVLINGNFGTVNHRISSNVRFNLAPWARNDDVEKDAAEFVAHKRAVFDRFCLLIPKLAAAIAPRNLVIRPHPAEDHAAWKEATKGYANAHVVFEGSVVPWIAAAQALIHNGCTSAVEAAIGGTPVLTYRPVTSSRFDNPLPNGMGIESFTDEQLLTSVGKVLDSGPIPLSAEQKTLLHRHIDFSETRLGSDAIFDAIERHAIGVATGRKVTFLKRLQVYLQYQHQLLPQRLRKLKRGSGRNAYKKRKFSGLTEDMVNVRIVKLQGALSRFSNMCAHEIGKNVLEIK
jgi:surface carbohydrate biosynthesis protein